MCIVLTTGPPGNLPERLLLPKEYTYFLSCLLWHLFVYFTSCMFLFYFSFLWVLSLTLVNKFSNNIGFLHTNTLHFYMYFIFGCTGSLLLRGFLLLVASKGYSTCSARTSHSNAFSCHSVWALYLCTVVVTPELWNMELWPTGLVSPRHVGTSRMRDRTLMSCVNYQADSLPLSQKGGPKACSLTCILEPMNWIS